MTEIFVIAICTLAIVLYLQSRAMSRDIRRKRQTRVSGVPRDLVLHWPQRRE